MTNSTTRDEFEAWHRSKFPNDSIKRSELLGYLRPAVQSRFTGFCGAYLAARRAALLEAAKVAEERAEKSAMFSRIEALEIAKQLRALADEGMKE